MTLDGLDPELLRIVLDLADARLEQQTCAAEDSIGRAAVRRLRAAMDRRDIALSPRGGNSYSVA